MFFGVLLKTSSSRKHPRTICVGLPHHAAFLTEFLCLFISQSWLEILRLGTRPRSDIPQHLALYCRQGVCVERPLNDALAGCTTHCGFSSSGTSSLLGHSGHLHRTPSSPVPNPKGRPAGTPSLLLPWLGRDWERLTILAQPEACLEFQDSLWNVQPVWGC